MLSRAEISPEARERRDETLAMSTDGPRASENIGFVVKLPRGFGIIVPPEGSGSLYLRYLDDTDLSFRVRGLCGTAMLTLDNSELR